MATKPPNRRVVVLFLTVTGMVFSILFGVAGLYSLHVADREDRVELFQRALYGVDELVEKGFGDSQKAESVQADLLASVKKMTPGHPDAAAFRVLAAAVQTATALGAQSPRSELEALEKKLAPLSLPSAGKLIAKRAESMLAWLSTEKQALDKVERAEAALARREFEIATGAYSSVPELSCFAPRVEQVREAVARGRLAEEDRLRKALAEQAAQHKATFDLLVKNVGVLIAGGNIDQAREWIARIEPDAPADARSQIAELKDRLLIESVRVEAEKAYDHGKGLAVLAVLQERTEPELVAFREKIARVITRYNSLLLAEEEGRPGEVEKLIMEITVLEPSATQWYHEQAESLAKTAPSERASRWLEKARHAVTEGHLNEARRFMEAAREVYPGSASDGAVSGLLSFVQKDFNLVTASLHKGSMTREAALDRINTLLGALLPRDKVYLMIDDFRKQLKQ